MSFSASDVERQHYVVMSAVLENPSENWPAVIVRLGITKEQLFSSLDYLDRERYVSGMRFARGGQKEILVPFTEKAAITERGIDFMKRMEVKKNKTDETTRPTVFVSYNDKSGREFVDALVTETKDIAQIIRYTDMGAWESFKEFMNSIRKQDFAVLVITDAYLKSYACLYEVMELMKEENWLGKTMFVIFDDAHNAFTAAGRASYIGFWNQKCNELEETIHRNPVDGDPFVYHVMSGGERRRLNLAVSQAFAYIKMLNYNVCPSLLFLDEVTVNVDPVGVQGIYNMILELSKTRQVMITTHDHDLLELLNGCHSINLLKANGSTSIV